MAKIKFLLRSENNPSRVYVRVREGRKIDVFIPTHISIDPRIWSLEKENIKVKKNNDTHAKIHLKIREIKRDLETYFIDHRNPTKAGIKEVVKLTEESKSEESQNITVETVVNEFIPYFQKYVDGLAAKATIGKIKKSTITKYVVILNILKRMSKKAGVKWLIQDIGPPFVNEFEQHCYHQEKYSPNTIGRAIKFLKTVCLSARADGLETHPQVDRIKGYTKKSSFITLSPREISLLEETKMPEAHLENAKDWLLISTYTAQRVSDFLNFTRGNIEEIYTPEGEVVRVISFTQEKTKKLVKLPVSKSVQTILDKRGGNFPERVSDQKYNKQIKRVCELAGIKELVKGSKINPKTKRKEEGEYPKYELVSSHIGRRSYATNKYGVIPTPVIMYATGHTTEKALLRYIGKTEDNKALELLKYTEI